MGLKVTTDEKGIKVYRKDRVSSAGNPYTTYCLSVGSKDVEGNWVNGFLDCGFKKGVSVNNKSVIAIKNAFYTVNKYNDKTSLRLMITDFDVIQDGEAPAKPVDNSFIQIPDGIEESLPFA